RTYYQGEDRFPDGMDNPIPNKFVVIKPGERFLFAIRGSASWRGLAKEMLILAADEYGFGAKTRVGYGRLTYCKNAEDLRLEIPEAGDKALVEIYKVHKGNAQLHDTFRAETEKRFYCPELDLLFRKYKPACCFLADLEDKHPEQWRDVKKIHDQHKKMLKNAPIDPVDPVIQEIFERCRPLAPENIPPWFQAFAPTPAHYIAGKTAIEIQNFLEKYRKNWPPLADFKQAIETAMHLSDEDKEECLLILEMKMEEIAGKETGDG
ncbi:MAG: hypothetical protein HGJ94_13885, partial [Desulfosarcina sp.]|nr:hypothetical protein [Desulfosarcina sp.]